MPPAVNALLHLEYPEQETIQRGYKLIASDRYLFAPQQAALLTQIEANMALQNETAA